MSWRLFFLFIGACFLWTSELVTGYSNDTSTIFRKDNVQSSSNKHKRSIISVLARGGLDAARGVNLGINFGQAISKGCLLFSSICYDMEKIGEMENEIEDLERQYNTQFKEFNERWVKLSTAITNNGYIVYYINETVREIQTLSDLQESNQNELESKFPKTVGQSQASENLTSEEYLDYLLTPLEYSLTDLQHMLGERRNHHLIGVVAQVLIESTISKFISSYSKAYKQTGRGELADTFLGKLLSSDGAQQPDIPKKGGKRNKVKKSLKLVPKAFRQMKQNTKKYFSSKISGVDKWRKINSWKGFKGKLKHSLKTPIRKLNQAKNVVTNSKARKTYLSSWKKSSINKLSAINKGVGLIFDGITTAIEAINWKKTADDVKTSRESHEKYLAELRQYLQDTEEEKNLIAQKLHDVIITFKDISEVFEGFIQNASNNADFAHVLGLSKLPISPQHSILENDFQNLNESSLHAAQVAIISLLRENDNNLTDIIDQMRARNILYTSVQNKVNEDKTVEEIFSNLKDIFNYNPSATVRNFGMNFSKKDSLCAIAIMLIDEETYDHFNLEPFRPSCNVTDAAFTSMEFEANTHRQKTILNSIVKRLVEEDNTVDTTFLLIHVKSLYSLTTEKTLQDYGQLLTEKDIVCSVATQFPEMKTFDFINLSVFRPDCDAISSTMFTRLKIQKGHLRPLMAEEDIQVKPYTLRYLISKENISLSAGSHTDFLFPLFLCPFGLLIIQ